VWHDVIYTIVENEKKNEKTWGAPGTANVTVLESRATSSALRFPLEVSERSGDDRGAWCGAVPDAAATREKEGINVEAAVFDDDDEAIRVGEGLY
jgi:hypothetical protein